MPELWKTIKMYDLVYTGKGVSTSVPGAARSVMSRSSMTYGAGLSTKLCQVRVVESGLEQSIDDGILKIVDGR